LQLTECTLRRTGQATRCKNVWEVIVDFYDKQASGTYYSSLYSLGCQGKNYAPKWSTEKVREVLNKNEENLTKIKAALEEFVFRNGSERELIRSLYVCVGVNPDVKSDEENEVENWLVQCVASTITERATLKRPRDEKEDSYPEAVVSSIFGGLMLCCHKDLA
jgi:hypothetical protein